jgi:hypothetical protein
MVVGVNRFVCIAFVMCANALAGETVMAQSAPLTNAGVEGRWAGQLGRAALRLVIDVTKTTDGLYFGTLTSVDQGSRLPIDKITVVGDSVVFEMQAAGVTYVAALSSDKTRLVGVWTQGGRARLELTRTAPSAIADPKPSASSLFGLALTLNVPVPPTPFAALGKQHLAYEVHVANHSGVDMLLRRLEIFDGATMLARWEGGDLHAIVAQRRANVGDNREIPAGGWAIAYVWVTLDASARVPRMLRHRLTVGDQTIEGAVSVARARALVVGPPLRGGDWTAANGPGNSGGHHRRALVPIGGQAFIAQRFAIDWAKLGPTGQLFAGDQRDNRSYFAYDAEVVAVADATVEAVKDGISENVPGGQQLRAADQGDTLRAVPMTLETVAGNYIILKLGEGSFAFYGHLKPGSLRVKAGDRVRRGVVIARVGNSGNSTGPHLHFHISDRPHPLAAEGIPYVVNAWELMRAPQRWERRANELPMLNARVRFPDR